MKEVYRFVITMPGHICVVDGIGALLKLMYFVGNLDLVLVNFILHS